MLKDILSADATPRQVRPQILSVLPPEGEEADYDSRATAYDRVVGSTLYNQLMWGVSPGRYQAFARRALASGTGPFLDAGAGSAVFTASAYVEAGRSIVLVDRSLGMLQAARERIVGLTAGTVPDHVVFLHADVLDLPLEADCVETILSMGMLHLFEDVTGHVKRLLRVCAPEGTLFTTSLVSDRYVGRQYLRLLHAAGEVATPRTYDELLNRMKAVVDCEVDADREGNMAFVTALA